MHDTGFGYWFGFSGEDQSIEETAEAQGDHGEEKGKREPDDKCGKGFKCALHG
jgi:hypothetical protein